MLNKLRSPSFTTKASVSLVFIYLSLPAIQPKGYRDELEQYLAD